MWASLALAFVAAFAVSWALNLAAVAVAPKLGLMDVPGGRKDHGRSVPVMGGAALLGATWLVIAGGVGVALLADLAPGWLRSDAARLHRVIPQLAGMGGGCLLLLLVGMYDDRRALGPLPKLAAQVAAGLALTATGTRATVFLPEPFACVVTICWVVVLTNAFNFLDNMDGLCGGLAAVSTTFLALLTLTTQQYLVAAFLIVLLGAIGGFLAHNLPPARIFMGDAGSTVLGFLLASLSITTTYWGEMPAHHVAVATPLLLFAVPLYDITTVMLVRLHERRPLMRGDHAHISHRLADRGLPRSAVVVLLCLFQGCFAAGALLLGKLGWSGSILLICQALGLAAALGVIDLGSRAHSRKNARSAETADKSTVQEKKHEEPSRTLHGTQEDNHSSRRDAEAQRKTNL